jgi:glycosyltransferase involved in cell wall biosynthesis
MFMSIADVAVAPYPEGAAAGGARNKTLEYFKYEIPVVSTVEGIRGIDGAMPEKDFILSSDEPLDFLQKIIMCIGMDNKKRQKMIDDANDLVTQNYTWEKSAKQLNDFLKSLA